MTGMIFYQCQGCNGVFEWDTDEPAPDAVEIKTIANRFCGAQDCLIKESETHGLPVERIRSNRQRCGRAVSPLTTPPADTQTC